MKCSLLLTVVRLTSVLLCVQPAVALDNAGVASLAHDFLENRGELDVVEVLGNYPDEEIAAPTDPGSPRLVVSKVLNTGWSPLKIMVYADRADDSKSMFFFFSPEIPDESKLVDLFTKIVATIGQPNKIIDFGLLKYDSKTFAASLSAEWNSGTYQAILSFAVLRQNGKAFSVLLPFIQIQKFKEADSPVLPITLLFTPQSTFIPSLSKTIPTNVLPFIATVDLAGKRLLNSDFNQIAKLSRVDDTSIEAIDDSPEQLRTYTLDRVSGTFRVDINSKKNGSVVAVVGLLAKYSIDKNVF